MLAEPASIDLEIGGMSCASCVRRIERALTAVPGVVDVAVNLATERAHVVGAVDAAILGDAVRKAGYEVRAKPVIDGPADRGGSGERLRLVAAGLLTAPLLAGMVAEMAGLHWMLPGWVQFGLASVVQFWLGAPFYVAGWKAVRAGSGNMALLVALGTSAAWALSTANLLAGRDALYFESGALIITFVLLGKWLEGRAKRSTAASLRALMALRPNTARVQRDGVEAEIAIDRLRRGDRVVVRPGERIAADGVLIEGGGSVDESMLTGESLPVDKEPGANVTGGSINLDGLLVLRVTAIGAETTLARIVRMVESAQSSKAPIQRLVDRVAAVFVPAVLGVALLTFLAWFLVAGSFTAGVLNAVAVMVIACPCALGLATPAAIIVGTGAAARRGILIRDAEALERAHAIQTVAFDKTGTLTEGRPTVTDIVPLAGHDRAALLGLAASLQSGSEHPLARAVVALAAAEGAPVGKVASFRSLAGRGVTGSVDGRALALGNARLMTELGIDLPATQSSGQTVSWLAAEGRAVGTFTFGDPVKPSAADAVAALHRMGIATAMLTGDNETAARAVAGPLGIADVRAAILPEGKAEAVVALRQAGRVVAMVGDGVNDAPALAAADVGIAMATGTDVAMQTAGIALLRGDPALVADAIDISRRTYVKIRQGLFWAFAFNLIGIPLAASGWLSPALAGAAMALSSVSVVSNALWLQRWRGVAGPVQPR